jgi:cytosine/adenosine deaminase-related metal-dependent hydrolase
MDHAWTCGECGERFETSDPDGDFRLMRWRREHKEEHRRALLTPEELAAEGTRVLDWRAASGIVVGTGNR